MAFLAPSILSADFSNLKADIEAVESAGAHVLHIDVMDGRFVPNITVGPCVVESIKKVTKLPLDVHLMIVEPERYVDDFAKAGADWISFHWEAAVHHHRVVERIKELGLKAGIALNPSTPVNFLEEILPFLDFVLIMTVNPGFGGQRMIGKALEKVRKLKDVIRGEKLNVKVEVDGGVKVDNVRTVVDFGVDIVVAGSAVFSGDTKRNVRDFLNLLSA